MREREREDARATIARYEDSVARPAGKRFRPASDEALLAYSRRCAEWLRFGREVASALDGSASPYDAVLVSGHTPPTLRAVGLEDRPILHTQSHVRAEMAEKDDLLHHHGIPLREFLQVPEKLERPWLVFDSPQRDHRGDLTHRGIVAMLDVYDVDGIPLSAYLLPNGTGQYRFENVTSNFMTSVYGRDHLEDYIRRAADLGLILYVDARQWDRIEGDPRRVPGTRCLGAFEGLDGIVHRTGSIGVGAPPASGRVAAPRRTYSFGDIANECEGRDGGRC